MDIVTVREIAEEFNRSIRTVTWHCVKCGVTKIGGQYLMSHIEADRVRRSLRSSAAKRNRSVYG